MTKLLFLLTVLFTINAQAISSPKGNLHKEFCSSVGLDNTQFSFDNFVFPRDCLADVGSVYDRLYTGIQEQLDKCSENYPYSDCLQCAKELLDQIKSEFFQKCSESLNTPPQ